MKRILMVFSIALVFQASNGVSAAVDEAVGKGHPNLFATADDFARLKDSLAEGSLRALAAKRVVERAEGLLEVPPVKRVMEGRRLLLTSRKALARISTLSMAYRLSGDGRMLDRAVAELKAQTTGEGMVEVIRKYLA